MSRATLSNASPAASSKVSERWTIGVRTRSRTNSTDVVEAEPRVFERGPDGRHHLLQVGPGGDLRHDTAEAGVLVHARRERVAEQGAVLDEPHAGLVAGGLDAHDD